MILAGIDEAGLGPNLGPLASGCVAIAAPDSWRDDTPWTAFAAAVADKFSRSDPRPAVADSKLAYAAGGVAALETALAVFHSCLQEKAGNAPAVTVSGCGDEKLSSIYPWHSDPPWKFPVYADSKKIALHAAALRATLQREQAGVAALQIRLLHPRAINRCFAEGKNKSETLMAETGAHIAYLCARFAGSGLRIVVDKQGGRNDYLPFLSRLFPGLWIDVLAAGAAESSYRLRHPQGDIAVAFRPKADKLCFAAALASMAAKYARERSMEEFNGWFGAKMPGLKATAGYPVDARRWLQDARDCIQAAELDIDLIWRQR